MINFFRKIRRRMLIKNSRTGNSKSGKFSKYLLYAIGEIALVMIGILLALQVNNWNNGKQLSKIELKYLTEIKNSLELDQPDIEFNIRFNENQLKSNQIVRDFLNGEMPYSDTLDFHFANLLFSTRTIVNTSAFENLKSRGLEIIKNDSLRQLITQLYSYRYYNIIDFETKDDHEFQFQVFIPEVMKALNFTEYGVINGFPGGLAKPLDTELLRKNYSFKNAIMVNITLRDYILNIYKSLKKRVENCIAAIERELIKRKT